MLRQIHEFFYTLLAFPRAWSFMRTYRLWEGLRQYGWVARFLVVVGVLIVLYLVDGVSEWFDRHQDATFSAMIMGQESILLTWITDAYDSLSGGALNWVTLVLLEVVIYHFMRRTLQIVLKKNIENAHAFKPFLEAQKRMIIVSFYALIVQTAVLNVAEAIHDGLLYSLFAVLFQALLLGYVIADNYNEQFGLTIKQSARNLRLHYLGICLGLGLPLFLMLKVPLLGTVLGPLVTSVTAAIVLREKSDLHIIGYQMSEKERQQAAKKAAKEAAKEAKRQARQARRKGGVRPAEKMA
ncbi:hypothetical protein QWY85_06665 [Neolewinella lacunae]|uniref:Uncharacterized protein n=1 Tax=Neolewinella lacunae TaxID=1517758 RepID=A0A923T6G9_9BACT|nr:hypothetical protein [Neolewinella lacunae]MBC6992591.1 hypothetical protein [Neolewinella lacunae]MDN3634332.1 hypothetical protein [Neolewinella lacunae]